MSAFDQEAAVVEAAALWADSIVKASTPAAADPVAARVTLLGQALPKITAIVKESDRPVHIGVAALWADSIVGRATPQPADLNGVLRRAADAVTAAGAAVRLDLAPALPAVLAAEYDLERLSKAKRAEIAAIPTLAAE